MKEYIKAKIVECVQDRVSLMTRSMLRRNAWFRQTIDRAMKDKHLPEENIEAHFKDYRDIMFKYEAIDLEIKKLLMDLKTVMDHTEFELFRFTYLSRIENEYMVEILTKSELDVDKAS